MNYVVRVAIVDPGASTREELKRVLSSIDIAWLEGECEDYRMAPISLEDDQPDLIFVAFDNDADLAVEAVGQLKARIPDCEVCAVSRSSDGPLILRAMRAGAKEFVTLPADPQDLADVIKTLAAPKAGSADAQNCTTIAVVGATGGVGTTSIAVNVASILASDKAKSTVLVDLDLALGDADVFLDAVHDYTLVDVAENISRMDIDLLRRSLTKLNSGLFLLPRPIELEDTRLVSGDVLTQMLDMLKSSFSHLVLDLSKSYSELDMAALEASDIILLVTQMDLPCLRNVVRLLKTFRNFDGMYEKVRVVVNRSCLEGEPIRQKKAQEIIGREIAWQIPNDYRLMVEVGNNGVPLIQQAPKANLTRTLVAMTSSLCGELEAGAGVANGSATKPLLGKLLGKLTPAGAH